MDLNFLKIDLQFLKTDIKFLKMDLQFLKMDLKFLKTDLKFLKTDLKFLKTDLKLVTNYSVFSERLLRCYISHVRNNKVIIQFIKGLLLLLIICLHCDKVTLGGNRSNLNN